jgi:cytochrome c-type biogenesis protein CcmH/NrfF
MDFRLNETLEQRGYDLGYWIGVHLWWAMLLAVVVGVVFLVRAHRRQRRLREHQRLLRAPHSSRS